ncbi:MAG: V-type ATPase subunit [Bacilli bacterium]|nr:V-type ATPase subunit [Bacilli bacterium]
MNYPYANGYFKVIENNLLDKSKLGKLCRTDKEDFFKALLDLGYGYSGNNVEELIESELLELRRIIDELTPEKKYTDLFFLFTDAINIKAYYKMKLFTKIDADFYSQNGNLTKTGLQKAIFEDDYREVPKTYQKFLSLLSEELKNIDSARILSSKIDNAIFRFANTSVKFTTKNALKTYFSLIADQKNILSLIRSRNLGWDYQDFQVMFLENGEVKLSVYKEVYSQDKNALIRAFSDYYQERLSLGLQRYFENNDLDGLEKYFDQLLLEVMKTYRNDAFGIGPMLYYYLLKQTEAKNLKLIYASDNIDLSGLIEY